MTLCSILKKLGFDFHERSIVEPYESIIELASRKGIDVSRLKVPEVAILSLSPGITPLIIREFEAKESRWLYLARPLYIGNVSGAKVAIIWASPGSPLAAMVMEDLISCGAKYIFGIGLLASIQPHIEPGSIVIPTKAIRGEGTSHYYLPEEIDAIPDVRIINLIDGICSGLSIRCFKGTIYTTDAIYRETGRIVEWLKSSGVLGIDMETAAIYSVGMYRSISTACIHVVSTNLYKYKSIGFYKTELDHGIYEAIHLTKELVKTLQ